MSRVLRVVAFCMISAVIGRNGRRSMCTWERKISMCTWEGKYIKDLKY